MAERNIVTFPQTRVLSKVQDQTAEYSDNVVFRTDVNFWMKPNSTPLSKERVKAQPQVFERLENLNDRVQLIQDSFEQGNFGDVIMQSARFSLVAQEIGLPKTAKIAADIGETLMRGQSDICSQLITKLDGIVYALVEDLRQEAQ